MLGLLPVSAGKRRRHALRQRPVVGVAQEWVQPDQAPAAPAQQLHLRPQQRRVPGVPAVAEDDHHCPAIDELVPILVEGCKALTDPRPTRPVVHFRGKRAQHPGVVGLPQDAAEVQDTRIVIRRSPRKSYLLAALLAGIVIAAAYLAQLPVWSDRLHYPSAPYALLPAALGTSVTTTASRSIARCTRPLRALTPGWPVPSPP